MHTWRQWTKDASMHHHYEGCGAHMAKSEREDRHLLWMAVMNCTVTSTTLALQWRMMTHQAMSASPVCRWLLYQGLVALCTLLQLPLIPNHTYQRLQWCQEQRQWNVKWECIMFSDKSRFNPMNRIPIHRYSGKQHLEGCIAEHHMCSTTPSTLAWDVISFHACSCLLWITGTMSSQRYITEVLEPEVLPLLQTLLELSYPFYLQVPTPLLYVAQTVHSFLCDQQVALLSWPAQLLNLSPTKHMWDMIAWTLDHMSSPTPTTDELWMQAESVWNDISQTAIQNLYCSMPCCVQVVI